MKRDGLSKAYLIGIAALLATGTVWTDSAYAADRDTALALLSGADNLIKKGSYEKALKMCDRALSHDKTCPKVYLKQGYCYEKLSKIEEAFASYQTAERHAREQKDGLATREARAAIKRMSPGLLLIKESDEKLLASLIPMAEEAYDAGHLGTANRVYAMVLANWPDHAQAKAGVEKCRLALSKRGDPVKGRIAQAMLSEVWYFIGMGSMNEARGMARKLTKRFPEMAPGREAQRLLAADFKAPEKDEVKALAKLLATKAKLEGKGRVLASAGNTNGTRTVSKPARRAFSFDLSEVEDKARKEAGATAKADLVSAFEKAYRSGLAHYRKGKPGAEGNQEHLASALKQFIRCEALFIRAENLDAADERMTANRRQASMLRYACMKMAVLH